MPFRDQRPTLSPAHRSELDRQAINAACHVLLSVVWLERRVAMHLVTLSEKADARRAVGRPRHKLIPVPTHEP